MMDQKKGGSRKGSWIRAARDVEMAVWSDKDARLPLDE